MGRGYDAAGRKSIMSVKMLNSVWNFSQAKKGDLLVLLAIADFANDAGEAWPSVSTIAAKSRLQVRQTQYALQHLAKLGELRIAKNKGPRGCHKYTVLTGAENAGVQKMRDAENNAGGAFSNTKGVHSTAPEPSENHKKNHQREESLTLEIALSIFDSEFPEKNVKGSLSRMAQKGRLLTPSACRKWLENEKEARRTSKATPNPRIAKWLWGTPEHEEAQLRGSIDPEAFNAWALEAGYHETPTFQTATIRQLRSFQNDQWNQAKGDLPRNRSRITATHDPHGTSPNRY